MVAQNKPLPDVAYDYIKKRILDMSLKPGEPLPETEIARQLGISRTPVREALRRLTIEGLVSQHPKRGHVVYSLSLSDIEEIFDIKIAVEGLLARRCAERRDEHDIDQLQQAVDRMQAAAQAGDVDRWMEVDRQFHDLLQSIAGNERARQLVENLNEQWHRLRLGFLALEGRIVASTEEHKKIALLISAGDGTGAAKAMQDHLVKVRNALLHLVRGLVIPYVGENL